MRPQSGPWAIHWFRRDLRLTGNAALREAWKKTEGRVLGLFCFDAKFLARPDFSHNRFAFFLKTLRGLKEEMRTAGGDLIVIDRLPRDFFPALLEQLETEGRPRPNFVSWNRDYEPFARARDAELTEIFRARGVEVLTARDHLLFEPHEISKDGTSGGYYQVYSPFSRKWFDRLNSPIGKDRLKAEASFERSPSRTAVFNGSWRTLGPARMELTDSLDRFESENAKSVTVPIPAAGFPVARSRTLDFHRDLPRYKEDRDRPDLPGTSRLSMFLKNGSVTPAQIAAALKLTGLPWKSATGPTQFLKELVWREFYYHILFHRPDVEHNSFNPAYRDLAWENRTDFFERWKEGTTGFPIVDAGMRELRETGWMHNRVRMIVASFLTKDLLIDWRWGERYFMEALLDGDLAPNNGGWQWAASTGCDPQPYFRIFNPWLQSAKFDPEGTYIRRFVKELQAAPATDLHDPNADRKRWKYPPPMVVHAERKELALAMYKVQPERIR